MAGDIGHVVGPGRGGAAERARAEVAVLVAVKRHPGVLEPQDLVRSLPAHDLDRVLVSEVVRALDGVERVRLPGVLWVECRVYASRGRNRVRADRMNLGHDAHRGARLSRRQRRALTREPGADDQNLV